VRAQAVLPRRVLGGKLHGCEADPQKEDDDERGPTPARYPLAEDGSSQEQSSKESKWFSGPVERSAVPSTVCLPAPNREFFYTKPPAASIDSSA
jgi:hypothetical protein